LQENYPMKNYFLRKSKAQATIEFSMALILAVLFLFLSCNLFVWLNHNIVGRQKGYEETRKYSASVSNPGMLNFYTPKTLNIFSPGGYEKERNERKKNILYP
ncbi:MAG: hypothetical protein Q8R31_05530, partial [Candidatus Omnitrophota bacterium]|nr:hypothetical protein [Candidatus Omnitrophota bacterium]